MPSPERTALLHALTETNGNSKQHSSSPALVTGASSPKGSFCSLQLASLLHGEVFHVPSSVAVPRHGWLEAGQEGVSKSVPSPAGGHGLQHTVDKQTHLRSCQGRALQHPKPILVVQREP